MLPVVTSIVSVAGLVLVAILTFVLNERAKRSAAWQDKKLEYYAGFFDSLAQNLEGYSTPATHASFSRETNNMNLVASPEVISALHAYRRQIASSNIARDYDQDDILLTNLVKAMRIDLGVPDSERLEANSIRLWASGPTPTKRT